MGPAWALVLVVGTGACGAKNRDQSAVEALQVSIAAFNRGDVAGATAPYAADVEWSLYGTGEPVKGRDKLEATWKEEIASEDLKLGLTRVFAVKPDRFFAEGVMRGTYDGTAARPVEPRAIGMTYITEYLVKDGAIAEVAQYGNSMALATQMGGLPGKPPPVPDLPTQTEVLRGPRSDAHEATARSVLVAMAKADWATVRDACDPDLIFMDVANGRTHTGFEGRRGAWADWASAFPGGRIDPLGVWSVGDWVVAKTVFEGSHEADLAGLEPTHRAVQLVAVDVMQFKGDSIVAWWRYSNPMVLLGQLGLVPPGALAPGGGEG